MDYLKKYFSNEKAPHVIKNPGESVHAGFTCDCCAIGPIKGIRYSCSVREDYDLCGTCFKSLQPLPHPMIEIDRPLFFDQSQTQTDSTHQAWCSENPDLQKAYGVNCSFELSWTFKNLGSSTWPSDTKLIQVDGDDLNVNSIECG